MTDRNSMTDRSQRAEFFTLYGGLLKGLNLAQQKSWDERELQHFFADIKNSWLPYLEARHPYRPIEGVDRAFARLHEMLLSWEDEVEKKLLEKRLEAAAQYLKEASKPTCDQETLMFFLEGEPLVQLAPSITTRPFATSSAPISAVQAQRELQQEVAALFPQHTVNIKLTGKTLARASTGKDSIRLREDHSYTREELRQLTVHEAWVHLGTNLQGSLQNDFPWLAHWNPGVTVFQEGLALIAEIVGGCWTERRMWNVIHRHQAALLALRGWNARLVYDWLLDKEVAPDDALATVLRVYRGCSLEGGMAFGKEFLYVQGLKRWSDLASSVTPNDMVIALCGKMSFSEWEVLRAKWAHRLVLPGNAPRELLTWMQHFQMRQLRFKLSPAA